MIVEVVLGGLLVAVAVAAFIRRRSLEALALRIIGADAGRSIALPRGRMGGLLGRRVPVEDRDRLATIGRFSVADALLGASMEGVLETFPFSELIAGVGR